ncbi:MAG: PaaI family thioesterase [Candidatus Hydrogenedentes bacterium]|jgi:uncharacterized protein (TIGR00369 family)|nr:PaaI family thioesterase [Candidatus Hydrogenedentota bacterium]
MSTTSPKAYLPNSDFCFVCGEDNQAGLQTRFYIEGDSVRASLKPRKHHCGYLSLVHGGIVAAIIDECMVWAASRATGRMCVTAELTLRYLQHLSADREYTVVAEVTKSNRRLTSTKGAIIDSQGTEYAKAEGKFSPMSPEETMKVDDMLIYRGGEERLFDALREVPDSE